MASSTDTKLGLDPSLPKRIEKPWGHEVWFAHTERYAGKIITVKAGHRLSLQYHDAKDETSHLVSGRMRLWQGPSRDELVETVIEPGATWRNTAGTVHTVEAIEDATFFEVSTPELDDVVRLEDQYGREGTSQP
ncbi:cupin [Patulibacter sp. SYSU D01012]|uniref:cupin n=1 Tax=Patulibacter sp. SYSU D01012 TaxID=2817381 RepID=UPI001B315EF8|nr:cupin [Patulibacter sp. SYSU D01012]